jgi:hypothetical protein
VIRRLVAKTLLSGITPISLMLTFEVGYFGSWPQPAHAQFYYEAEKFLTQKILTSVSGSSFGSTSRGPTSGFYETMYDPKKQKYVIRLAISAEGVEGSVKQNEDWQTSHSTPLSVYMMDERGRKVKEVTVPSPELIESGLTTIKINGRKRLMETKVFEADSITEVHYSR